MNKLFFLRLLNYSINLFPRGIHHAVSTEIFPTLSRNKYGTGAVSIQAGSALLAKDGICFIGDLSSHKKDKLEQLQSGKQYFSQIIFHLYNLSLINAKELLDSITLLAVEKLY